MTTHSRLRRGQVAGLVAVVLLAVVASGIGAAQDGEAPDVTLTSGTIDVEAGETSSVTTEYEFRVDSAGSGDQRLTAITGKVWKFPDRSVSGFSATVGGEEVSPEIDEQRHHYVVSIPVEDVSDGDTVTVTMTYEVAGPAGRAKVPVFVPDYSTTGETPVIDLRVEVPGGQQFRGDTFPRMDSVEGNVATSELLHVPGFVDVSYGESGSIGLNTILSTLGVLIVVGVLAGWAVMERRRIRRAGGEHNVS